jgi:metallophosphoesterase superfamily enzyme
MLTEKWIIKSDNNFTTKKVRNQYFLKNKPPEIFLPAFNRLIYGFDDNQETRFFTFIHQYPKEFHF